MPDRGVGCKERVARRAKYVRSREALDAAEEAGEDDEAKKIQVSSAEGPAHHSEEDDPEEIAHGQDRGYLQPIRNRAQEGEGQDREEGEAVGGEYERESLSPGEIGAGRYARPPTAAQKRMRMSARRSLVPALVRRIPIGPGIVHGPPGKTKDRLDGRSPAFDRVRPRLSDCLDYLPRLEATGAKLHVRDLAVDHSPHLEEIGPPAPPRAVLGMGNGIAEGRAFSANFAFSRHCSAPIE